MAKSLEEVKDYYNEITAVDIKDVAMALMGDRVTQETERLLECDCPNHQSQSKRSFHVMLDLQAWYCHGCGVGGDVLHLVEFIQSGQVTTGLKGEMPLSHRKARDFLADHVGLLPLGAYKLSDEEIARRERLRFQTDRVFSALTCLANHYHRKLKANPEVLAWCQDKYGITVETIDRLKIGFADNDGNPGIVQALMEGPETFTRKELVATGAFRRKPDMHLLPFFSKRLVFPYWSRGRVINMIGRKTPWTPKNEYESSKYKKLVTHHRDLRPHVAPCIDSGTLFNEDVLLGKPKDLVITEGITDCISLMEQGFHTLSPVTVRIRKEDWERLLPKLKEVDTVYICLDNELSQVGLNAALDMALAFEKHEILTRIIILPLGAQHEQARMELKKRFAIRLDNPKQKLSARLKTLNPQEKAKAEALIADAKIDVNAYFAAGHTAEDFQALMKDAPTPLAYQISLLDTRVPAHKRRGIVRPVLERIAVADDLTQHGYLKMIQERFGKKDLPMESLVSLFRKVKKEVGGTESVVEPIKKTVTAEPGTCREAMEQIMIDMEESDTYDPRKVPQAVIDWFKSKGGSFFVNRECKPFLFFNKNLYWMDGGDPAERRKYAALMLNHTFKVMASSKDREFFDVMTSLASEQGSPRDFFSWLYTDRANYTVYFHLGNAEQEIAKISPEGVTIIPNGGNTEKVILVESPKMKPIHFVPDADLDEAGKLLDTLIVKNLTCSPGDAYFILAWLASFLLIDFAGTRPMTRFEGGQGSGKTTASKLISTLLYGSPQQKISTEAALYSDGTVSPLVLLDNLELKNVTEGLTHFFLTCITGVAREKRFMGSNTKTVLERPNCLINSTGIEPLGAGLSEVLSRTFTVMFDAKEARGVFLESEALVDIQKHRDYLLSAIFKKTSAALALMANGGHKHVVGMLEHQMGNHDKRRCNDYLALMYLVTFAGEPEDIVRQALANLNPMFVQQIENMNETTNETAVETNAIATALHALFHAYRLAVEEDEKNKGLIESRRYTASFHEKYQVKFESERCIRGQPSNVLFVALKRIARDYNLAFRMDSVQQFGRRFSMDMDVIEQSGFKITWRMGHARKRYFTIVARDDSPEWQEYQELLPGIDLPKLVS